MTDWTRYLPSVLQIRDVYWIIAVCVATVCGLRTLPDKWRKPWLIQLGTLAVAIGFAIGVIGRAGLVYAFGSALICSSLSTSFYDLVFSAIESRIRAFLGAAPPVDLSSPRPANPNNVSTEKLP